MLEPIPPIDPYLFAKTLYDDIEPLTYYDTETTHPLWDFCVAFGGIFQQMYALARSNPAWGHLVDIETCPDEGLPWLGQLLGVPVDITLSPNEQRQQIRDHDGWNRGTVAALKKAVGKYLTGTKTVDIVERDTSAYHFSIFTYSTETPSDYFYITLYGDYNTYSDLYLAKSSYNDIWLLGGQNFINEIIRNGKPAGLQYTYTVLPGAPGTQLTYVRLFIDFKDYDDLWLKLQSYEEAYERP